MLDTRGQANYAAVLFLFFGTIIAAAFVFVMLDQAAGPMLDMAENASNSSRLDTGIGRARDGWNNWAWFVAVLAAVLGLAGAASASRGGRF